jgi:chemotaxis protein histidine kinase CheA
MAYDPKTLADLLENGFAGDWEIFEATASAFLESLEENLISFKAAHDERNLDGTMRWAHRLKGETSLFKAAAVSQIFRTIEHDSRAGSHPPTPLVEEAILGARSAAADIRLALAERKKHS